MVGFNTLAVLVAALLPAVFAAPVETRGPVVEAIPDSYIITLKSGLNARDLESHLGWVTDIHSRSLNRREFVGVKKTYSINNFHGYAGTFDPVTIETIKNSPQV